MNCSAVIAISAFRSDEAVLALLQAVFADPHPEVASVIVVDSLGSGRLPIEFAARGWPVRYENADRNLGSAGNLARRVALAADLGAKWCLCMNHDANWSSERLSAMLKLANSRGRVGAVFPVLHHGKRHNPWEDGRRTFAPSAGRRHAQLPTGFDGIEVMWSSSNGALYATAPLREGVRIMDDLWMGYEDLAYGIALFQAGWQQLVCRDAVLKDIFDLAPRRVFGRDMYIPDKPAWYSYYNIRNLLLIRRRYGKVGVSYPMILRKLVQSTLRILLLEQGKVARLGELYRGAAAGLVQRAGKGPRP